MNRLGRKYVDDISGKRFGFLVCLEKDESVGRVHYFCRCDCGRVKSIMQSHLCRGVVTSCGCKMTKGTPVHGLTNSVEWKTWSGIKRRCYNSNEKSYNRYGGRGIKVCDRWKNSFENFYKDMGPRPSTAHQIDRIDNDGPYSPDNCRWTSRLKQANNKSNNRLISFESKTLTLAQWSRETGINAETISTRLKSGWPVKKALTFPVRKKR